MSWIQLRKTGAHIHLTYGLTYTNNLVADNFRLAREAQPHIAFDLNRNLHVRHRSNQYDDACDLARGELAKLKFVQLDDDQILDRLTRALRAEMATRWRLSIDLNGVHDFVVRPEASHGSLFLHVV